MREIAVSEESSAHKSIKAKEVIKDGVETDKVPG